MGLSFFNRMRRERKPVEKMEAERFKAFNAKHQESRAGNDALRSELKTQNEAIREEELAAMERVGEKTRAGMGLDDEGRPMKGQEGRVIDEPLRLDHAAEIAGRNLVDVDRPKDPVERVDERIPDGDTAVGAIVAHTQVDGPGPTKEMVDAANVETGSGIKPGATTADAAEATAAEATAEQAASDAPAEAGPEIPDGWRDLGASERRELATKISGEDPGSGKLADSVIRAELERQAAR